jgi:hypothetical protein
VSGGRHALALCLALGGASLGVALAGTSPASSVKTAGALVLPLGLSWGMSPQAAQASLAGKNLKFVGPTAPASLDELLHEQRWEADVLGRRSDQVAPLFFGGQLFGVAVSWSPTPEDPASRIWESMTERFKATYGKPARLIKAPELVSADAILRLIPPEVDKSALMAVYAKVGQDPVLGRFFLLDLEVMSRVWTPDATWEFDGGAVLRVVMRAATTGGYNVQNLKPAVIWMRPAG